MGSVEGGDNITDNLTHVESGHIARSENGEGYGIKIVFFSFLNLRSHYYNWLDKVIVIDIILWIF